MNRSQLPTFPVGKKITCIAWIRMKPRVVHLLRVLMFVAILLSIHWQHRKFITAQAGAKNWSDALPVIRQIFASADAVRDQGESQVADVVDAQGTVLGHVIRTSPVSDHILGFSGPTDVLVAFDSAGKSVAAKILSSRDTRDHVQKVLEHPDFLKSLAGRTREELLEIQHVDAVSGATLTSYAVFDAVRFRVALMDRAGQSRAGQDRPRLKSLKFPDPPRLEDVQLLYPVAASLQQDAGSEVLWHALDAGGKEVGDFLRASPAADNTVGYQGPTDLLIAVNSAGEVSGLAVGVSYDNEPYVGYVREDRYFRNLFNGRDLPGLAAMESGHVEGVSGATMTSQAVARSLQLSAQAFVDEQLRGSSEVPSPLKSIARVDQLSALQGIVTIRNLSTIGITLVGVILGLTHLRGLRWLRVAYQCVLIGWLGLINGDMVSQALLLGWAQSGIPWQNAFGLSVLTAAAVLVPIFTGRNVYCSHICPHGAVQQLVRRRLPWQAKMSPAVVRWLKRIPVLLIGWVIAIGILQLPFSAVDIEPFDAWLWTIAGAATISVAVVGLAASLFVPIAYCRFGCPTGALLDYFSSAAGKTWNQRDWLVLSILIVAGLVAMFFEV